MSGQYKLLRNDGGDTPVRKRSCHKTFSSAVIELGRGARKNTTRDLNYQIRLGNVILLSKAGADARAVRTDDPAIAHSGSTSSTCGVQRSTDWYGLIVYGLRYSAFNRV